MSEPEFHSWPPGSPWLGLRESEERFRLLVESVVDYAIFMLSRDGIVTSWNVGAQRIKGYTAEEILGQHFSRFYTPEDVASGKPARALRIAAAEGRYGEDGWRLRKTGERFWASVTLTPLRDEKGHLSGFAKVTRDMTEMRRAAQDAEESRRDLAATLDSIGHGVVATDRLGHVERVNQAARVLTGWTEGEAKGRPLVDVVPLFRGNEGPLDWTRKVLPNGSRPLQWDDLTLRARDGTTKSTAGSAAAITDDTGAVRGSVVVFGDISAQVSAERALAETEERFRLLVEGAKDYALFMLDEDGRVATWNDGARRIKGYTSEEIIGRDFSVFYPPEDVAAGRPERALAIARSEDRFESEGWRIRKDGSAFWANVVLTALRDPDGRLRGFAKLTRDFSERRRAEETARRLEAEIAARHAAEKAQARILASERRYQEQSAQLAVILQSVGDGIVAEDASGALIYANDRIAQFLGHGSAQRLMRAGTLDDVLSNFQAENGRSVSTADLPGRQAMAGVADAQLTLRTRPSKTGTERWFTVSAQAVLNPDGTPALAVTFWREVTEARRRQIETEFLAEATSVLSVGLDPVPALEQLAALCVPRFADWAVIHRLDATRGTLSTAAIAHPESPEVGEMKDKLRVSLPLRDSSDAIARVASSGRSELFGAPAGRVSPADSQEADAATPPLTVLQELNPHSGLVVPLTAGGRIFGTMAWVTSDSHRRYGPTDLAFAEEVGRRAGLALENAQLYQDARDAVRLRDEFMSIAGHELNTPLAAMLLQLQGVTRLLEKRDFDPERVIERANKAVSNAARLERLIRELLDVSRASSGRLNLEREPMDLAATAEEVLSRFADQATQVASPLRLVAEGPVHGSWDRLRIDQVITNLVSNALKYGAGRPVTVTVTGEPGRAWLSVRDEGIGIPLEHQHRVFGAFERAVSPRQFGGLGLGLWITRQICEAHGGRISLESRPEAGATFLVELPR